jgi:hypothetical protein
MEAQEMNLVEEFYLIGEFLGGRWSGRKTCRFIGMEDSADIFSRLTAEDGIKETGFVSESRDYPNDTISIYIVVLTKPWR